MQSLSSRVVPWGLILLLLMALSWFKEGCFPLTGKSHKTLQLTLNNAFFCISLFPLKSYPNCTSLPFETGIKLKRSGVAYPTEKCFFNVQRKSIICVYNQKIIVVSFCFLGGKQTNCFVNEMLSSRVYREGEPQTGLMCGAQLELETHTKKKERKMKQKPQSY